MNTLTWKIGTSFPPYFVGVKNSRNEAVKMITERGTSERLSILGVMK